MFVLDLITLLSCFILTIYLWWPTYRTGVIEPKEELENAIKESFDQYVKAKGLSEQKAKDLWTYYKKNRLGETVDWLKGDSNKGWRK